MTKKLIYRLKTIKNKIKVYFSLIVKDCLENEEENKCIQANPKNNPKVDKPTKITDEGNKGGVGFVKYPVDKIHL